MSRWGQVMLFVGFKNRLKNRGSFPSEVCCRGQRRTGCRGWTSAGWRQAGLQPDFRCRCLECRLTSWWEQESLIPELLLAAGWTAAAGPAGSDRRHGGASPSPCAGRKSRSNAPCCSRCTSHWPYDHSSSSSDGHTEKEKKKPTY